MSQKATLRQQRGVLSRQLLRQVLSLGMVAVLGLVAVIALGLQDSLQDTESQLGSAGDLASNAFARFFGNIISDLQATSDSLVGASNPDEIFRRTLDRQVSVFELDWIDSEGRVLAQRRRVAEPLTTFTEQPWLETVQAGEIYIGPVDYSEFGLPFMNIAVPVVDSTGNFTGTLLAETDLTVLWEIIIHLNVGQTGYVYIADETGQLLVYQDLNLVQEGVLITTLTGRTPQTIAQTSSNFYSGVGGERVIASGQSLDVVPWFVIVEQPIREALRAFALLVLISLILFIFVGGQVINVIRFTNRRLVVPLGALQAGVEELRQGYLEHAIKIEVKDELGDLASSFNSMATQLQEMIGNLEQRVAERTKALETSVKVSRQLSAILSQEKLVKEVVEQVRHAFNYYHAHVYLWDETRSNLMMAGGTGEAGQLMLARKHSIPAGKGLVGRSAMTNDIVLVPDVSQVEGWLPNPLLPETKSEVAVPIAIGEQVLGVLDVQHSEVNGLQQIDAELLLSIANQLAVALQNATLLAKAQEKVELQTLVNTIGQRIQSATTVERAMQIATRELGRAVTAPRTRVQLITNQTHLPASGQKEL